MLKTPYTIPAGEFAGWRVRRAHKNHGCERSGLNVDRPEPCGKPIPNGSLYVEGPPREDGQKGRERYCMECVDEPARAAVAAADDEA